MTGSAKRLHMAARRRCRARPFAIPGRSNSHETDEGTNNRLKIALGRPDPTTHIRFRWTEARFVRGNEAVNASTGPERS